MNIIYKIKMNKKSQLIGNVFIYIFSAVVIAVILIFGYKSIIRTTEAMKQSDLELLKNRISSDVQIMSSDYGSSKKVSYNIPENAKLCLFDLEKKNEILQNQKINSYPIIKDRLESNAKKNAFLISSSIFEPFYLKEIEIEEPYFYCLTPIAGKVSFVVEGKGNRTLIFSEN